MMYNDQWTGRIFTLLAGCLFVFSAQSATFTVDTTADLVDVSPGDGICATATGQCALRAAIMEANALANDIVNGVPVADVININDGNYVLAIAGAQEDLSASGDLDITDSVILNGNSTNSAAVVIDAGGAFSGVRDRVFHIIAGKSLRVEFNYLVITGGYSDDTRGGGGGICIDCLASDSEAYQPTGLGSMTPDINTTFTPNIGFLNQDSSLRSTVILRFVTVQNNYDIVSGAGIMNAGILTIENSVIQNNATSFIPGDARQGVFNAGNSQFIGGGNGGAISNWGGKLTIRNSILDSNTSQTGGAIYSQTLLAQFRDEQVLIENSQIVNNLAFMGGAIFNLSGDWNFPGRQVLSYGFIISQSTIDNNRAEYAGGGIYNLGLGVMQLSNTTVSNNAALDTGLPRMPNKGGGIYHSGKILDLVNTTISGNTAINPQRMGSGGSITADIADDSAGGDEIFIDVTQANIDPMTNLPWRFTLLNSLIGDANSTDACRGTTGYENFITDIAGNVDNSGTCFNAASSQTVNSGGGMQKVSSRSVNDGVILGILANNGGIPGKELPDGTFPPTRELISGGAIGKGVNCNAKDQRGFGRSGSRCDAGAFQTLSNTKGMSDNVITLPVARDDEIITAYGVNVLVPVSALLANDNDPLLRGIVSIAPDSLTPIDSNVLSVGITQGPQANNMSWIDFVSFTPVAEFTGQTGFTYRVKIFDSETGEYVTSDVAQVRVFVSEQNLAPVAYSQSFSVMPGETKTSDLTGSLLDDASVPSFDPENASLRFFLQSPPAQGSVSVDEDGSFVYAADADAKGTDSFTYFVQDDQGLSSKPAVVSVYVEALGIDSIGDASATVEAGRQVSVDLSGGATAGRFFFGLKRGAALTQGEILWLNEETGELLFRANEDASGSDVFEFSVVDLDANSNTSPANAFNGSVTINVIAAASSSNTPAVADDQEISATAGTSTPVYMTATDAENDVIFYSIESEPSQGVLSTLDPASGSVIYTANPHASGTDEFRFSVSDGVGNSRTGIVSISLRPVDNKTPKANDDVAMTPNDLTISVNVLRNDSDDNGDELRITLDSETSTQGGQVVLKGKGVIQYTPPSGFVGEDSVGYQLDDGYGGVARAKLTISVIEGSEGSYPVIPSAHNLNTVDTEQDVLPGGSRGNKAKGFGFGGISPWLILFGLAMWLFRRRLAFT